MLVLSRRAKQIIRFPDLGIRVEILKTRGSSTTLGIEAPADVRILRGEVEKEAAEPQACSPAAPRREPPKKIRAASPKPAAASGPSVEEESRAFRHAVRNSLNCLGLGIEMALLQLQRGDTGGGRHSLEDLRRDFVELGSLLEPGLRRAAPTGTPSRETDSRPRLLIVEDQPNERELLAGILRHSGFDVLSASDAESALIALSQTESLDTILMDINLPGCDGQTLARRIWQSTRFHEVPILAVSGAVSPPREAVENIGFAGWISKPVEIDELVTLIHSLLRRK